MVIEVTKQVKSKLKSKAKRPYLAYKPIKECQVCIVPIKEKESTQNELQRFVSILANQ